ncbi:MAG: ROK family protein [Dichotomicrobium sp.]
MKARPAGLRLVADVGGTNARFALASADAACFAAANMQVAAFTTFPDALRAYLERIGARERALIDSAAIAAAGPVDGDTVKLTNAPWQIASRDISVQLGGVPAQVFNDLQAVAFALPFLGREDVSGLGAAPRPRPQPASRMVAVNVGTGFGAATAVPSTGGWLACPSEAGHMSLAGADAQEAELLAAIAPGRVATLEDVLCGAGVGTLYGTLSGRSDALVTAGEAFARFGDDPAARRTVEVISRWLGRAAGDLVLATAAWGGAFLLGGVVSGWQSVCDHDAFRAAFSDKGKMRERMSGVFTGVITRRDVALFGLARAPVPELS